MIKRMVLLFLFNTLKKVAKLSLRIHNLSWRWVTGLRDKTVLCSCGKEYVSVNLGECGFCFWKGHSHIHIKR
jgi:hypothetical protein